MASIFLITLLFTFFSHNLFGMDIDINSSDSNLPPIKRKAYLAEQEEEEEEKTNNNLTTNIPLSSFAKRGKVTCHPHSIIISTLHWDPSIIPSDNFVIEFIGLNEPRDVQYKLKKLYLYPHQQLSSYALELLETTFPYLEIIYIK